MEGIEERELVRLAELLLTPSTRQWLPDAYTRYEEMARRTVETSSREAAIHLIVSLELLGKQARTHGPLAILPPLVAYCTRFGKTPELLVEVYRACIVTGGPPLDEAPGFLREAARLGPQNYHVLWELWRDYPTPWFPQELRLASDGRAHELECLKLIQEARPQDKLAHRVQEWVEKSNRRYVGSNRVPIPVSTIAELTRPTATTSLSKLLEMAGT